MFPKRIVAIGASTCEGGVDVEGSGFVGRLRRWLEEKDQHNHVFNLGISGDIAAGILKRLPVEAPPRRPDLIMIATGSNDSTRIGGSEEPTRTSPETLRKNITAIVQQAEQLADHVLVVGINPIDDNKTQPTPWAPKNFLLLEDVEQEAKITKEVCEEEGVDYIDVWSEWIKGDYAQYLHTDGLHPNSAGHERTFQMLKKYLLKKFGKE